MYNSILSTDEVFMLYIFCFDDQSYKLLNRLNLQRATLIKLEDFENNQLLSIKCDRSKAEYCWTCTSFIIRYCLDYFRLSEVTYVDADLYFFKKPSILLDEFHNTNKSVLITEHRYTPKYDQTKNSGIYCVQFMTFRSDNHGLRVLQWWQDRCLEWCFNRVEDGKFGDQKYLDNWVNTFEGVHVLQHLGGGVAPWNVQQYCISEGPRVDSNSIVFYHFHGLKWMMNNKFDLSTYNLNKNVKYYLYYPYIQSLLASIKQVQAINKDFLKGIDVPIFSFKNFYTNLKRIIFGRYNIVKYKIKR